MRRMLFGVLLLGLAWPAAAQVPNMEPTVKAVFASATWDLTTKAGAGCFTEAVAHRLHQLDANWGHLAKFPGQNQYNGHAVDAVLYKSGYAVDIIGSVESPKAKPWWGIDKDDAGKPIARYTNNAKYFLVPTASCAPGGTPPDEPNGPPTPSPPEVDLEPLKAEIAALRASYAALEANLAQAKAALGAVATLVADEVREREALAEKLGAVDALARDVKVLQSRPIPDGCVVQFFRCRLSFVTP